MSDSEHEYLLAHESLRAEVARLREVARRALQAAVAAQDAATGRHDAWLDADLLEVEGVDDSK
jgi:hypothetical protein